MSLTKYEWWSVCRRVKPALTWSDYELMWDDFQARKAQGRLAGQVH